ncbi:AIPR family protein [Streptomyces smyrnaeus]|uniref:AIPR family protein n=1 Tax=Streptomyces smyrnaeus TaxID=1387713 RepID=UPI00379C56D7
MTPPNLGIVETLRTVPENFWYFNNGITVLCDSIETEFFSRPVEGAPVRLRLTGATVVNGAQTVASIYYAHTMHPQNVVQASVQVRFISRANAPEDFARSVGAATNTQHHTEARDFVALDEVQGHIRDDFRINLNKEYVFRRGELIPTPAAGCSLEEAAVALACGHPNASLSALANASTEHLWEATSEGAYTRLFGRQPSALQIWRSVLLLRAVREALHELRPRLNGRSAAIAERGTLLVTHLVFRLRGAEGIDEPDAEWETAPGRSARARTLRAGSSDPAGGRPLRPKLLRRDDLPGDRTLSPTRRCGSSHSRLRGANPTACGRVPAETAEKAGIRPASRRSPTDS